MILNCGPWAKASAFLRNLLKMYIPSPHPRPTESDALGVRPDNFVVQALKVTLMHTQIGDLLT